MEELKGQKYLNPITFEAEMFVNSLEELSKTYNNFDEKLVNSLEKVMLAIETFLDQNHNEIVGTENIKLMACDDIKHIKRIYHCIRCKTDLGKSAEKVTLHLTTQCGSKQSSESNYGKPAAGEKSATDRDAPKISKKELRREKRKKQNEKLVEVDVKLTKKTKSLLTTDLNIFFSTMVKVGEKLKCLPDYDVIEKDLVSLISPLFPNQRVKVYKFGSRIAGIGTRESDLDLFIDIGDTYNNFQNRAGEDTLKKLNKVYGVLNTRKKSWSGLLKIDKARVPILKIIHAGTGIECDINFSNSMGNINTQFIEFIFTLQPIARLMCIFLKKWLNRTQLSNDINTYTIILMVIFYLQILGVLPAVEKFQQNINPEKAATVGPWLCSYATLTLNQINIPLAEVTQENVHKLITEFFQFYINFDYETGVVCPYLGKFIKRGDLEKEMPARHRNDEELSDVIFKYVLNNYTHFQLAVNLCTFTLLFWSILTGLILVQLISLFRYTTYVQTSADYALQLKPPFVVQDPIQLNHNVSKGLSLFTVQVFKTLMARSLEVML